MEKILRDFTRTQVEFSNSINLSLINFSYSTRTYAFRKIFHIDFVHTRNRQIGNFSRTNKPNVGGKIELTASTVYTPFHSSLALSGARCFLLYLLCRCWFSLTRTDRYRHYWRTEEQHYVKNIDHPIIYLTMFSLYNHSNRLPPSIMLARFFLPIFSFFLLLFFFQGLRQITTLFCAGTPVIKFLFSAKPNQNELFAVLHRAVQMHTIECVEW